MEDKVWLLLEEADWYFRRMVRRFVKERDKIIVEGMSLPAFMILHKLERHGQQRLGDLAEEFDFTSGAVTALADKLEAAGLAWRKRPEADRRTVLLEITAAGRQFLIRHGTIGLRCMMVLFAGFTEAELQAQTRYYRRIAANLEEFSAVILRLAEENLAGWGEGSLAEELPQAVEAQPHGGLTDQSQELPPATAPKDLPRRPGDFNKYFSY